MFKKVCALFLIGFFALVTPAVWADTTGLAAETDFAWETTLTTITGTTQATEGARVHLLVLKPGYSLDEVTTAAQLEAALCRTDETVVSADGSFSFTPFVLGNSLELGDCHWRISVGGATAEGSFYYAPLAKIIEIINNFDSAAEDAVYDYLVTNQYASSLGLAPELMTIYKDLTSTERAYIDRALAQADYGVTLTTTGAEVRQMLANIAADFKELVALGLFNDAETPADITAAFALFNAEVYEVDTTFDGVFDGLTAEKKEDAVNSLYQKAAERVRFSVAADISDYFVLQAVLTAIDVSSWDALHDILVENNDVLQLDLTAYNQLSTYKKDQVMKTLAEATGITDASVLQSKLDAAVTAAERTADTGSGGGGGRTGTTGSSLLIDYVNVPEATDNTTGSRNDQIFSDIGHVAWAEESILALYSLGIINGKEAGKFYPNDAVTRAEFVKMLVEAFGDSAQETDISFKDVAADAWYYPYIAKSVQMNLVNGYDNENFGANDKITRQDMATVLYRLITSRGVKEKASNTAFQDVGAIAEYAEEAIRTLSAYGVFSGDENGNFRPQDQAGRAETAKVIYAVIGLLS